MLALNFRHFVQRSIIQMKRAVVHVCFQPIIIVVAFCLSINMAVAQTTAFNYQGRLSDGGSPANGSYDVQLRLFDSSSGGNQVGTTLVFNSVPVTNGVFTLTLEFGAGAFPGPNRFLEIAVKTSGAGSFTVLSPRQPLTSAPYAIRSLGAAAADGLSLRLA
jgi:hypothetical protein